jgi:hypothetical protein
LAVLLGFGTFLRIVIALSSLPLQRLPRNYTRAARPNKVRVKVALRQNPQPPAVARGWRNAGSRLQTPDAMVGLPGVSVTGPAGAGGARPIGPAETDGGAAATAVRRAGPVRAPDSIGPASFADEPLAAPGVALFNNRGFLRAPIEDFRSPEAVRRSLAEPLALPATARPFGKHVVFRPALSNINPSPAFLFRLARYTDRLLVAYANATPGQDLTPRPVTEIYGHPVPPELRGKIWVSGDPGNRMISWDKLADLLENQLDALDGSEFLGGAPIDSAGLTMVALSAGGADAVATRRRLEASGRTGVVSKLVNVASPMRGAPIADEAFFGLVARALKVTRTGVPKAVKGLDPDTMRRAFPDRDARLVDLAVTNTLEGEGSSNAHPVFKMLAKAYRWNPFNRARGGPSDGWVDLKSMEYGRDIFRLTRAYDHAGVSSDPAVVDAIAGRLMSGSRGSP